MLTGPAMYLDQARSLSLPTRSSRVGRRHSANRHGAAVVASGPGEQIEDLHKLGLNQLQTGLRVALSAEDYSRAAEIKQRLSEVCLTALQCQECCGCNWLSPL